MIDQDLEKLAIRDSAGLAGLEQDIWRREAEHATKRKTAFRMTGWQIAVMFVAVISSAGFGLSQAATGRHSHGALFAAAALAPSNLILGSSR